MSKLILMRHGQSLWNMHNLFTGWVDVALSQKGIDEALKAGQEIADIPIDVVYSTTLIRAQMTAMLALSQHSTDKVPVILHTEGKQAEWGKAHTDDFESTTIPVHLAWELNERMYGELQGLNKKATADKYGADQVKIWRRSYDIPPPNGESLEMTAARSIPYFQERIVPELEAGKNVLISAHGNSLRSIVMDLDALSKEEVLALEIPTGVPLLYSHDSGVFTRTEINPSGATS